MDLHQTTAPRFLEEWCLDESLFAYRRHQNVRKKLRPIRILGLFVSIVAISTFSLSISAFFQTETHSTDPADGLGSQMPMHAHHQRTLLDLKNINALQSHTPKPHEHENTTEHTKGEYPKDLFSLQERRRGAIILHVFGMIYMFIALAIVCDEFFVPSLTVITEKLAISDDVAGATFMAAGGSAPELFTSLIGVFIAHSNVGIGTIVGSAVFNILFVIGMCALFSREVLNLTWWPLFRDVSFYIIDLIMLIVFFLDNLIMWWESLILLTAYFCYVTFMKFNVQVERCVKQLINRNKVVEVAASEAEAKSSTARDKDEQTLTTKPRLQRGGSSASLHNSLMRNSIFQLMIHTLDPLAEGRFREKASILHKIAKKKCQVEENEMQNGAANHVDLEILGLGQDSCASDGSRATNRTRSTINQSINEKIELPNSTNMELEVTLPSEGSGPVQNGNISHGIESAETQTSDAGEEDEDQPLSLAWPTTTRKQITFLIVFPIVFPLWITLPDVRKTSSRKFFPISFFGSITWIAIFSYLMVWWAHQVGETIGISEEIMGLTILAAGTSIPDLITSVIVARKGLGDMAVSSSVGSNIFDITVGLPLPWLLFTIINNFKPVAVSSNGLFCAIVLLFIMLLFVIISIAVCRWRMNKLLGFTMFGLYFVFLVISVLLEDRIIVCPISI
ncbi:sodium/potassium/calcium exchanger 2 isoform X3 [Tachyglossus aculeatus]|uniref:sodium/potassium/calcium exchanger 2 isoform X3 n=1 Tax=Tachyglossus aculeatus TaxID=9261 RepID=UPI0018F503D3|nr:sodium/potassium/calcium exchanger 2 isoform X3 [Tachyglossus aculeatus]